MMPATESWRMVSPHLAEQQISQIDLLMAMYPNNHELLIEGASEELLHCLRKYSEEVSTPALKAVPTVVILLTITIDGSDVSANQKTLQLDIAMPFSRASDEVQNELPRPRVRIRQAPWLSRMSMMRLNSQIPQDSEDVFTIIQSIQEAAYQHLEEANFLANNRQDEAEEGPSNAPLDRVWFYFPSISTRSKRDDFILNAPAYHLTGFLCAGKPGLLCLEGKSQSIDDYMRFIKTESWGDIPAHHKKVSERHREKDIPSRVFQDMQEITDSVGERRGQRANRGDMKAIEVWLVKRGLGDAFAKVLM